MSGHNKWTQIKHRKGAADIRRGKLFSKLLRAITIAAPHEPNPKFNARLRAAVQKAKDHSVPHENIERAISRARENGEHFEEFILEAYGPDGVAILMEVATDNLNRTVAEVKKVLADCDAKWASTGSVRWVFEESNDGWRPKFLHALTVEGRAKLNTLREALEGLDDVREIVTNAAHQ